MIYMAQTTSLFCGFYEFLFLLLFFSVSMAFYASFVAFCYNYIIIYSICIFLSLVDSYGFLLYL